jgi:cytochrome c5
MKVISAAIVMTAVCLLMVVGVAAKRTSPQADPAAYYTSKCVMCHGKKAEKKFDTTLTDDQLVEVVLKGKKAEKPPNMPGYAEKGVTAEQAKALVDHMKSLKAAP